VTIALSLRFPPDQEPTWSGGFLIWKKSNGKDFFPLEPTILTFARMPRCSAGELGERFAMPLKHTPHGRQNRRSTISIALSSLRALYALKSFAEKAPGSLYSNVLVFLCRVLHQKKQLVIQAIESLTNWFSTS
jgi:hypothetical protein